MSNESPWRTLAERITKWEWKFDDGESWHINTEERGFVEVEVDLVQDLLIGRALRVARSNYQVGSMHLPLGAMFKRVAMAEGDARAATSIELLDAVGYTND